MSGGALAPPGSPPPFFGLRTAGGGEAWVCWCWKEDVPAAGSVRASFLTTSRQEPCSRDWRSVGQGAGETPSKHRQRPIARLRLRAQVLGGGGGAGAAGSHPSVGTAPTPPRAEGLPVGWRLRCPRGSAAQASGSLLSAPFLEAPPLDSQDA